MIGSMVKMPEQRWLRDVRHYLDKKMHRDKTDSAWIKNGPEEAKCAL